MSDVEMSPERWRRTSEYLTEVFGGRDPLLDGLMARAVAAGLPDIAVSADVGRLLSLLVSMTRAEAVLEVGTLAGYSGIWMARALAPGGRLTTLEKEPRHADFARAAFRDAGVLERVELVLGDALETLPRMRGPYDVVFLDAVKTDYPRYFELVRDTIRPGGLLVADNVLGSSRWWIDHAGDPNREAVDRFNRAVAADPAFEAACVPSRQGVLVARRR